MLIYHQKGIETEQAPHYTIKNFDFNPETRISHIEFLETKKYRRIERYVTRYGVRHPIYSNWISKTKSIKKTIKLTNEKLENLKSEPYPICDFCYEIVSRLDSDEFYPSWYIYEKIKDEEKAEIDKARKKFEGKVYEENEILKKYITEINDFNARSALDLLEKDELGNELEGINQSLQKAENKRHIVLFSFLTIGIYLLFHSNLYISKLNEKKLAILGSLNEVEALLEKNKMRIVALSEKVNQSKETIKRIELEKETCIDEIKKRYEAKIQAIEGLPITFEEKHVFIPLKTLVGLKYEKIKGCYVIRNTENGKCYAGQSKDVINRICRQHFNGTKVKNIIFAEDYYNSTLENKDDLFEVRIIPLSTKDELDRVEMELIEEYDSFQNGYNQTKGNS